MKKNDSQLDKFKELAREAECDLDEKKFDRSLRQVSQSKTKKKKAASEPDAQ